MVISYPLSKIEYAFEIWLPISKLKHCIECMPTDVIDWLWIQWFDLIKLHRAFSNIRKVQISRWDLKRIFQIYLSFSIGLREVDLQIYDAGLEILAFPCNQFGGQEPGSNRDIKNFACTRYKAEFPIFDKVDFLHGTFSVELVNQFLKVSLCRLMLMDRIPLLFINFWSRTLEDF